MTGEEVRHCTFHEQFRGYNPKQVDELLEQIAQALDSVRPLTGLLVGLELRRSMRGYRMTEVDELLDRFRLQS